MDLINPGELSTVTKGYSHGVSAEGLVFVAGQLPLDAEGTLVGEGDIATQTARVFENVSSVLKEVGLDLADVVSVTVYIADLEDYAGYSEAYQQAFGAHAPARATVRCDLVVPGALVEAQAIAVRRG